MSALCLLHALTSRQFKRRADPNNSVPLPVGCFVIADGHRSCWLVCRLGRICSCADVLLLSCWGRSLWTVKCWWTERTESYVSSARCHVTSCRMTACFHTSPSPRPWCAPPTSNYQRSCPLMIKRAWWVVSRRVEAFVNHCLFSLVIWFNLAYMPSICFVYVCVCIVKKFACTLSLGRWHISDLNCR